MFHINKHIKVRRKTSTTVVKGAFQGCNQVPFTTEISTKDLVT